jgi:hypothetical protein
MPTLEFPMTYAEFLKIMSDAEAELLILDEMTGREYWGCDKVLCGTWCPLSQSADLRDA